MQRDRCCLILSIELTYFWFLFQRGFPRQLATLHLQEAKLGPSESQSHVTTRVMGTHGYATPEYVATGNRSNYLLLFSALSIDKGLGKIWFGLP